LNDIAAARPIPDIITIAAGDSRCAIFPALGGAIVSWDVAGQNMLRRASAGGIAGRQPLEMSTFPLVPYSNRIGQARFSWQDRDITLAQNFLPEPHAIHGTGWTAPWQVTQQGDDFTLLQYEHYADDHWPWHFVATQMIKVTPDTLRLELSATNLEDMPVPLAIGHHPYFDQAGAKLDFEADGVWLSGEDNLPTQCVTPQGDFLFGKNARVEGRSVDHCFSGWNGQVRITWAARDLALHMTTSLNAAVIYIPAGGDAFCVEPVPHINNALHMPHVDPAMPIIAPGQAASEFVQFDIVPLSTLTE
jgi:aldose 1-epimerase